MARHQSAKPLAPSDRRSDTPRSRRFARSAVDARAPLPLEEVSMAIIARFSFDVAFGKKADALKQSKKFEQLERELGFPKGQVLIGSIGAPESRIEVSYRFDNLAALEAVWAKLGGEPRMADHQKEMATYIVPGSHRWDVFRIHEG
jgi:hypothetical protein